MRVGGVRVSASGRGESESASGRDDSGRESV